ncbi:MAG: type III-A CRISPR-associated RAMP protein Csm5 [Clostridia bacterium]|nr:type III-A CRISPR-associated RAMP protein Csm5 [Clostridia bacterium]
MKNYQITLEALTPVYIGNGKRITKKDFELKNNYINIYDPIKLHEILGKRYENFLMNNYTLTSFLKRNPKLNTSPALKYRVLCGDKGIRESDGIHEFIKDAYGKPYIPGSSLKGAIRTAILAHRISENKGNRFDSFKSELLGGSNEIERAAFGSIIDDEFKNLRISDSQPLSMDDLIISKKIDVFKDGASNNRLNLCRETLKPGTKINFTLTIDGSLQKPAFSPEYILNAIDQFNIQYHKVFLSKFGSYHLDQFKENITYLGGGTGFLTKTINHSLYGDRALKEISSFLDRMFRRHRHRQDLALGISPRAKKCTRIDGKTMEMGICQIRIDHDAAI